jgi:Arc/MetJ-type ribon-helix-helix transcriptional regulator
MDEGTRNLVAEKVTKRFPDGAFEQVTVLGYGDDPAVEPGAVGIRATIDVGRFPEDADHPLKAFHRAHEETFKQLREDLGTLPAGSWIEFVPPAEEGRGHGRRLHLAQGGDGGPGRRLDKERAGEATPVTARLGAAQLETLDTLITAGLAANRAEAVRWALDRIRDRPAFALLRERAREIGELAEQL